MILIFDSNKVKATLKNLWNLGFLNRFVRFLQEPIEVLVKNHGFHNFFSELRE